MKIDPGLPLSEKRAIAGSLGGRQTVKRHGKRYMKRLAKYAAHVMHSLYDMEPVAQNDFALVHKESRRVKALISGKPIEAVFGTSSVVLPAKQEEF